MSSLLPGSCLLPGVAAETHIALKICVLSNKIISNA